MQTVWTFLVYFWLSGVFPPDHRCVRSWYANLMRSYGGLLEPRRSNLTPLKSALMRNISYTVCRGLSSMVLAQLTLKMCTAAYKSLKITKTPIFGIQGRSRSSMFVPTKSSSAVLVMISSKSVSICNHSRARLVGSSRNRTFSRGYPNVMRPYGGLLEPRGSSLTLLKSPAER